MAKDEIELPSRLGIRFNLRAVMRHAVGSKDRFVPCAVQFRGAQLRARVGHPRS